MLHLLHAPPLLPSHSAAPFIHPSQTRTRQQERERVVHSCSPTLQNTQNEQAHTLPHTHLSCGCCIHK